jgi:hypothetical protein
VEISCQIAEHLKNIVICKLYQNYKGSSHLLAVEIKIQAIRREIASFPAI